jgi:hypothetical protein
MVLKMRRNFSGAFRASDLGNGSWRLSSAVPREIDVFLRGAERRAEQAFGTEPLMDFSIEWRGATALLSFVSGDRIATVETGSAIVHEPLSRLYDSVPLAIVDADARRFWRRVFGIVRLPGGRYLLKLLTRLTKR